MSTITLDALKHTVPAIFATHPAPNRSDKYAFVPTNELLQMFEDKGWGVASAKQSGKGIYSTHEARLRNHKLPNVGDTVVEVIIINSHNGLTKLSIGTGLHRLVCSNGLTVPLSLSEQFEVKHQNFELVEIEDITNELALRIPIIESSIDKMRNRTLSDREKKEFVIGASHLRWIDSGIPITISIEKILEPLRQEDNSNNMWSVFNVVQEKLIKGGIQYKSKKGRNTTMRTLKNISVVNNLNTRLWEMAESYC